MDGFPASVLVIMDIQFRLASISDVSSVIDLVQAGYRGDSSRAGWTHEADLLDGQRTDEEDVRDVIEGPGSRLLLAEDGDQLIGCCQLKSVPPTSTYLGMFAVSPEAQGGGIGRKIITEVERIAREELDSTEMRMSVIRQRAELIAWYERLGYERNGETLPFPYGDERFGIPKRDDLEFVILTKAL